MLKELSDPVKQVALMPVFPGIGVFVAKGDLIIGQFHNAVVADGHPQDIRGAG
jgi:hypothetical protein